MFSVIAAEWPSVKAALRRRREIRAGMAGAG
jgi:hypothetical protein